MQIQNIENWKRYSCNLENQPIETILKVLQCRLYDMRSCFGRGYGYAKYYLPNLYGDLKCIYSLSDDYIKMFLEKYKAKFFKDMEYKGY